MRKACQNWPFCLSQSCSTAHSHLGHPVWGRMLILSCVLPEMLFICNASASVSRGYTRAPRPDGCLSSRRPFSPLLSVLPRAPGRGRPWGFHCAGWAKWNALLHAAHVSFSPPLPTPPSFPPPSGGGFSTADFTAAMKNITKAKPATAWGVLPGLTRYELRCYYCAL